MGRVRIYVTVELIPISRLHDTLLTALAYPTLVLSVQNSFNFRIETAFSVVKLDPIFYCWSHKTQYFEIVTRKFLNCVFLHVQLQRHIHNAIFPFSPIIIFIIIIRKVGVLSKF